MTKNAERIECPNPYPGGIPGTQTTRLYAVSLPRWARLIQQAAAAVVTWTKRFEVHTRIG